MPSFLPILQHGLPELRAWWPDHEVRGGQGGRKTLTHGQVEYLVFERPTFEVFETADFKGRVYTLVKEADRPREVEQWCLRIEQRPHFSQADQQLPQVQRSGQDTDEWWRVACGQRVEGGWAGNSTMMTLYAQW